MFSLRSGHGIKESEKTKMDDNGLTLKFFTVGRFSKAAWNEMATKFFDPGVQTTIPSYTRAEALRTKKRMANKKINIINGDGEVVESVNLYDHVVVRNAKGKIVG